MSYLNGIILLIGLFTYSPLVLSPVQTCTMDTNYLWLNTELNISNVELNYYIHSTGEYSCHFTLDAVGNSLTGSNFAICEFLIHGLSLEGIELRIEDQFVLFNSSENNENTKISFSTINHAIPEGYPFTITGSYQSKHETNQTSIYTFDLGVEWGTTVFGQQTKVRFDDVYTIISIAPDQPIMVRCDESRF